MNVKKFFALAAESGITESEVVVTKNSSLSIGTFRGELENYSIAVSHRIKARGIFNGQMGFASSKKDDKDTPSFLVKQIKDGASVSESDDLAIIFKGSPKYKRKNMLNPAIQELGEEEKIKNLFLIEKKLKEYDARITEVTVAYEERVGSTELHNSHGLKLKENGSYFYYYAYIVIKDGEETKTGYHVHLDNKPEKFDIDTFVAKVAKNGLDKLGGKPCNSGLYPAILNQEVTASLMQFYLEHVNAENVQKGSSLFAGKLNEQVASKKVTIIDAPLTNNVFYSYFDGEGVAKFNKAIIEKGVLKSFLHNLSTGSKFGVESTGNAVGGTGKIGIAPSQATLKAGKLSFNELLTKLSEGFYLTEVQGLHAGMNPTSGDFSLQASGFMIKDGKIDKPVSLVTVAGNLFAMFNNILEVGSDSELQLSGFTAPSVLIKEIAVSGE